MGHSRSPSRAADKQGGEPDACAAGAHCSEAQPAANTAAGGEGGGDDDAAAAWGRTAGGQGQPPTSADAGSKPEDEEDGASAATRTSDECATAATAPAEVLEAVGAGADERLPNVCADVSHSPSSNRSPSPDIEGRHPSAVR